MVCVLFSLGSQQPRQSDSGSVWQMSSNTRAHSGEEAPKLKVKSRSTESAGLSREEVNLVTTCVAKQGLEKLLSFFSLSESFPPYDLLWSFNCNFFCTACISTLRMVE